MVALEPPVDPVLLRYVNRLSDLLFVLARVGEPSRRTRRRPSGDAYDPSMPFRLAARGRA